MNNKKKLTDSEREVMGLLWNSSEPLTSTEIIKFCQNRTWKPSYIHIMINSLLEKGMIKVAGFKQTTKNYARVFAPAMTREQWSVFLLKQESSDYSTLLKEMLKSIIEEGADEQTLKELSDAIKKRKKRITDSLLN